VLNEQEKAAIFWSLESRLWPVHELCATGQVRGKVSFLLGKESGASPPMRMIMSSVWPQVRVSDGFGICKAERAVSFLQRSMSIQASLSV
jgi:hypothetical protein